MKAMTLDKRNRVILVAIASAIVVGALWMILINSQQRSLRATQSKIAEATQKLSGGERLVKARDSLETQLLAYREKLRHVEDEMVTGDMYSWVISTMTTFKATHRVDIPQFSRERTAEVGILPRFPYKAAVFDLRGTAHYHDLGRFIAAFENQFPFMRVQNLETEPALLGSSGNIAPAPGAAPRAATDDAEKLSFRFEIVALIKGGESL